jgi:RHS repeat-associated protein
LTRKSEQEGYRYWAYYWSADDKLIKAEYNTPQSGVEKRVEYKYDVLGRRVARRLNGGPWRWYFYDGLQVTAEGTGTSDKMYHTHSPSAIGGIISRDNNGQKLWYHFDRLGNVMAVTDSNGNMYAGYTMEAFGNVLEVGTSTGYYSSQSDPQPYHLTTKEYDPDTGLYYFNARWYDSGTGRFVSRGAFPIQAEHSYGFCQNNPSNRTDTLGLQSDGSGIDPDFGPICTPWWPRGTWPHWINPPHCPFYRITTAFQCASHWREWGYMSWWDCFTDRTYCPQCPPSPLWKPPACEKEWYDCRDNLTMIPYTPPPRGGKNGPAGIARMVWASLI